MAGITPILPHFSISITQYHAHLRSSEISLIRTASSPSVIAQRGLKIGVLRSGTMPSVVRWK